MLRKRKKRKLARRQAASIAVVDSDDGEDDVSLELPRRVVRRESHVAAEAMNIKPRQFRQLRRWRAPAALYTISMLATNLGLLAVSRTTDVLELFSGIGNIARCAPRYKDMTFFNCSGYDMFQLFSAEKLRKYSQLARFIMRAQ